jgi:serine/threonine protein kinase
MHRYRESVYAEASQMPGFAFPAPQAVQIVMNTALALYASGAVHLDLKPDNLLLDAQGEAWLADFGISVPANPEDRTRLGIPLAAQGTPAYMSPEQMVVLASLDQRSDIYALGLILFELVTGRPSKPLMAPGQTMHQYLETLFETDPDWSLITDPELRRIANTAGCRMRKRRYETHLDLHADLAVWLESHVGS